MILPFHRNKEGSQKGPRPYVWTLAFNSTSIIIDSLFSISDLTSLPFLIVYQAVKKTTKSSKKKTKAKDKGKERRQFHQGA